MEEILRELTEIINVYCNKTNYVTEYLPSILSILAILISVYTVKHEKKLNSNNLQSVYYKEIFGEYLKTKIPEAGKMLSYDGNGKLNKSYKHVTKIFLEMYGNTGYFKYINNSFYTQLKDEIVKFDDLSIDKASKIVRDREKQDRNLIELHKQIENIVQLINRQYQKI